MEISEQKIFFSRFRKYVLRLLFEVFQPPLKVSWLLKRSRKTMPSALLSLSMTDTVILIVSYQYCHHKRFKSKMASSIPTLHFDTMILDTLNHDNLKSIDNQETCSETWST